jgi:two-component system sensor histidine kinase MtrB
VTAPARLSVTRARRFMRLGLRSRLTFAFALGAFVLSASLAAISYVAVRENLVNQRESTATRQAMLNARVLRDKLQGTPGGNELVELSSLETPGGASPVLFRNGAWVAPNLETGREDLPLQLREVVAGGRPARMRYPLDEHTRIAIGVPIPSINAAYFEISSFQDTEEALRSLAVSLGLAGAVTTIAGALLGRSASRRVLRPLQHVSAAAVAIAGGRLDTRVARIDDPDLGTLVHSFNDMASALQERIERDGRFASDVSHELRSPLTTLTASIQVLEGRRHELSERGQAALDLLTADVHRFSTMVADLLEISRFDAGAARLDLEPVRISELVMHAVSAATDADVPVSISADAAACTVQVDKRRLVRVIANLVENAARYGGGATLVDVALVDDDVRIAVQDDGPGVPEVDRDRIFDRFARGTDVAGRRGSGEGTGLGLALVREHVQLHGGRAWVEDRPDGERGARFVVELPAVDEEPVAIVEEDLGPAAVLASEVEA